jgi:hypothetical protein
MVISTGSVVVVVELGGSGDETVVVGLNVVEVVGMDMVPTGGTVTVAVEVCNPPVCASSAGRKMSGAQRAMTANAAPRAFNVFCTGITSLEQRPIVWAACESHSIAVCPAQPIVGGPPDHSPQRGMMIGRHRSKMPSVVQTWT